MDASPAVYTAPFVRDAIISAAQQLFGCIGGAFLFELVDVDVKTGRATILLDPRDVKKLHAAAACLTSFGGVAASLKVLSIEQPAMLHCKG